MSYGGNGDRDRNLNREGFNAADLTNAVVTEHDSEEVARYKIAEYRNRAQGPSGDMDFDVGSAGGSGTYDDGSAERAILVIKTILWGIGLLLLCAVLGAIWSAKDELIEHVREGRRAEAADKRIKEYADFSTLRDWPKRVQEMYKRQENKPLATMLDEIPENTNKLSRDKRHILGAQIWFKISSKGAGANAFLLEVQDTPHRVNNPILRAASLSLQFLKNECGKGVELACLDAARSFAGLVWHGKGSVQEDWVIQSALEQLPSSGPLATSPAIASLRTKLLATRESLAK